MPALRVLASHVEPVRGCRLARPAHRECRGGVRGARAQMSAQLRRGQRQQVDQDGWTESAVGTDALGVHGVDEPHEIGVGADLDVGRPSVADEGQAAQRRVEQVRGDVAHRPGAGDGLPAPVLPRERSQQVPATGRRAVRERVQPYRQSLVRRGTNLTGCRACGICATGICRRRHRQRSAHAHRPT